MTKEEYVSLIKEVEANAEKKKKEIRREYALSNSVYVIGDIIEDHCNKICVGRVSIGFAYLNDLPECIYYGILLKKNGEPFKNGKKDCIYQSNIKQD